MEERKRTGLLLLVVSMTVITGCHDAVGWGLGVMLLGSILANLWLFFVYHKKRENAIREAVRDIVQTGQASSTGQKDLDELLNQLERMLTRLKEELEHSQGVQGEVLFARERLRMAHRLMQAGMMSAGAAHDLRGPLSGIIGSAGFLAEVLPKTEEKAHKHVNNILNQANKCSVVIEAMLERARAGSPHREPCDLGELAANVLDEVRSIHAEDDLEITADTGSRQFAVVDCTQIWQAIYNLLSNGIQAVLPKGKLYLKVYTDTDRVFVSIEDNGPGIDENTADHVFEPLVTGKGSGTGLGLTMVKLYVEANDGLIELGRSDLGGARFVMSFKTYQP